MTYTSNYRPRGAPYGGIKFSSGAGWTLGQAINALGWYPALLVAGAAAVALSAFTPSLESDGYTSRDKDPPCR